MIKLLGRIVIVVSALYLVVMPAWLWGRTRAVICHGVKVSITDSSDYHLVTRNEILSLVRSASYATIGRPVGDIRLTDIEEKISSLRELKETEVYTTVDGLLHVYADQRNPIMRIIAGGGDYFLDDEGVVIRRKKLYTPRLHIAQGNISISQTMLSGVSVLDTTIRRSVLKDLYRLVGFLRNDEFWSAQIDQMYVDSNGEIDLIPRLGNHRIHLGRADNMEVKFRNLEAFYRDVMPVVGWNRYELLNLEFSNQIVCRRR